MSESPYKSVLTILDSLFVHVLALPRDVAICGLALFTVAAMLVVRACFTNQSLLRRCRADLLQLKRLRREAKHRRDPAARQRIARTIAQVQWIQMRADLCVLGIVILPLGALAMWAAERMEYLPIQHGETVTLTARFPLSSVERVAHIVPPANEWGDEIVSPPLQTVTLDPQDDKHGVARWQVRCGEKGPPRQHRLIVRHLGESATHLIDVGTGMYQRPEQIHGLERILETSVSPRTYRFLNVMPGLPWLGLPSWMVAYLFLTIALTPVARRVFRIS